MIVVSSVNQKGGTGKTTTVYNLSYLLARKLNVLVVDLDPQATLTVAYGLDPDELETGVDVVLESYASKRRERVKLTDVAVKVEIGGNKFDFVPSRDYLEGLNVTLTNALGRERVLAKAVNDVDGYDVILVDCQPTFSLLTVNAMVASDYVVVPVETAYFSIHGLLLLLDTVSTIKEEPNEGLKVLGIIPFKYSRRLKASKDNLARIQKFAETIKVYSPVPSSTYVERAIEERRPLYDFESKTAREALKAFEEVAEDIFNLVEV